MSSLRPFNGKQLFLTAAIISLLFIFIMPANALTTFLVNSTGNGSDNNLPDGICDGDAATPGAQCTLRAAIQNANDIPGHDVIEFASGITSIPVFGVLPDITDPLTIDGSTNGSYVELDGTNSSGGSTIYDPIGLDILAGNSTVRGMVINRFGSGIRLVTLGENLIENNRIGTDVTGTVALGNSIGIYVFSDDNTIGGNTAGSSNLISGNSNVGVSVSGSNAFNNHIWGNTIGLDISGAVALGNGGAGIRVGDADANFIGGALSGQGNVISSNGDEGVIIVASNATADGNVVQGNIIGLNAAGTAVLGNTLDGIKMNSSLNTVIGGGSPNAGNTISGNGGHGISIGSGNGGVVQGNLIGVDVTGMLPMGNTTDGIYLVGGGDSYTIGGLAPSEGNLISSNGQNGINISGGGMDSVVVQQNIIGLNAAGTAVLGNTGSGIRIGLSDDNIIGGVGAGNVISGNGGHGIYIQGAINNPKRTIVQGNFVGTNPTGTAVLGNLGDGIFLLEGDDNVIGGTAVGAGNLIGGNGGSGVVIDGVNASGNKIEGNTIGTNAAGTFDLGNGSHGVLVDSSNTTVGSTLSGAGNQIAFNDADGIAITNGTKILIQQNSIYENDGLGIDLADNGVTFNDVGDTDGGQNRGQNFPVLTAVANITDTVVTGTLFSENNNDYLLEFYANSSCDPSDHGEGETYLGSLTVSIGTSQVDFTAALPVTVPDGQFITATATDISGFTFNDSSEFSRCLAVPTAPSNDIYWTNPAGGSWHNPNNWLPSLVPEPHHNVFITLDGSFAVTMDSNSTVNSMTLGAANGTQTLVMNGRTLTLNTTSVVNNNGVLNQDNGTLTGVGDLTIHGSYLWEDGTRSGSGITHLLPGASLTLTSANLKDITSHTIINDGTAVMNGTGTLRFASGIFTNNGLFDAQVDALLDYSSGADTAFINNGTFRKSAGTGTLTVDVKLNNNGLVEAQAGTILFTRAGGTSSGTFDLTASAVVEWKTNYTFDSGTTFTGAGKAMVSAGTLTLNNAITFPGIFEHANGTVSGAGDINISGSYIWADGTRQGPGATNILPGATMTLTSVNLKDLTGQTLNNQGTVVMNGSGTLRFKADGSVSSVFNNNGLFDAQVDGLLDYSSGAGTAFNNNGIFRKSAGSGTTTVDVLFNNSGTVEANSGTIHFTRGFNQNGGALSVNGGDLTFAQALNVFSGTLGGSGTINGSVVNDAIVAPGFSPGQLSIVGTYAQTGAGQLNMEIGGTTAGAGFDRLDISGQATLSGTLNISLINSFSPASGSSFTIMTFASLSGDFANVTGLNLGDGRSFQLIYDATSLSLFVPTNSPPVAVDDTAVTNEDTPITIEVLANDMDGDGDTLIISSLTQPGSGSAVLNPDGTITYTPDPDYNVLDGSDNFSYTINDGNGEEDTAVVTLTVNPVNDAPVAEDDAASTPEDTAVTLAVLANDSDVDGDALTIDAVTQPGSGSAILNPNDTITYTPAASFNGSDSFSYTVSDGNGGSDTAVVSIQVAPENDNPTALNDTASTPEDTAVTIDVLANDSDIDGDTLTVTAVTTAANGTVQLNGDNSITFTPDANYNGADSFSYSVSDGSGGSASAGVTVAVNPVNDAPTAGDDSATTAEDTAVTLNALLNDTDVDGDTLTITAVTIPAHGAIAVNPDNSLTYTPEANYNGADSFSYSVSDPQGAMDTAQVTISITAVNDTPVANSDSTVTPEDTPVTVVVLANDTDVDGDALTVTAVTTATNGTVILNSDSSITYEPAASFNGLDGFSYTVNDGNGGSDSANVTITVTAENDNPTAADDSATTPEDTAVTLSILANDSDIDGDALVIDSVSQPANGVAVINADNSVTYTPNANFNGANSFNYTVSDGQGGSDTAVVSISVIPVNDAPVALDDSGTTSAGMVVMLDVLLNDSDIDGDVLSVASVVQPGSGTAVAHTDGTITYTPDAGFSGTDSFNYTVSDGQGGSDSALVTVNVTPVAAACDLYPIALHEDSLAGAAPGDLIADIFNGSGAGSFGWLTWTGDNSVNALVASLTPPGNSHTFINPHAPDDHTVSISDWVEGKPGLSNAKSVRDALDALPSVEIVVPVWDSSDGSGSNTLYHVSGFARVRLLDYQLAGEDAISMEFLGTVSCSE